MHEYSFELPVDGSFRLHLWGIWGKPPGEVTVALNDQQVFRGIALPDDSRHWRLREVVLQRGRHKLTVTATEPFQGALLSDDPEIVASGKAILLLDNRQVEGLFERRLRRNTDTERKLLVRHGFLFEREFDAEKCNVPSGVPLGGIGAGKVELTARGFFTAATMNNNQDCPIYRMPGSYFAVQAAFRAFAVGIIVNPPVGSGKGDRSAQSRIFARTGKKRRRPDAKCSSKDYQEALMHARQV